ncbi:MAG TPA: hypothetical protein VNL77_07975, partial [Roseiflexaceae bacterium]|nr:hypothetical protein [Roseiflexaceae bacterium]
PTTASGGRHGTPSHRPSPHHRVRRAARHPSGVPSPHHRVRRAAWYAIPPPIAPPPRPAGSMVRHPTAHRPTTRDPPSP